MRRRLGRGRACRPTRRVATRAGPVWAPSHADATRVRLTGLSHDGVVGVGRALGRVVRPGEQIAPMASFRSAFDELTSGVALLFEWDLRAHGEIHALEPLLPHTDAIGARFQIGGHLPADAIGRLARLAKRAAKPIRFRLDWNEEEREFVAGLPDGEVLD